MKILKEKMIVLLPLIVLAVVFIFCLTMVPSVNPTPKNLPIAIVNEDNGVELPNKTKLDMGKVIVENIKHAAKVQSGEEAVVKWIEVKSYAEVQSGLDNQKYYAALVIPKDFSQKQASLQTVNPSPPKVQILVNQGMHTAASNIAEQILSEVVDTINTNMRTQLLADFEKLGKTLTPKQAAAFVSPVTKETINIHETGTHSANGNAPVSLFQPLWMASIVGAAVTFLTMKKLVFINRAEAFCARTIQVLIGAVLALITGFGMSWIADGLIGIYIPQFTDTAFFLAITYFCFFLMISAVLSWIGLKGMPIFVLILFFGAPLLAMAPEFMSSFYREWIYSWLPMRFMVAGLRELFFFGEGLSLNNATSALLEIGAGSLVVLLASVLKPAAKQELIGKAQSNM